MKDLFVCIRVNIIRNVNRIKYHRQCSVFGVFRLIPCERIVMLNIQNPILTSGFHGTGEVR